MSRGHSHGPLWPSRKPATAQGLSGACQDLVQDAWPGKSIVFCDLAHSCDCAVAVLILALEWGTAVNSPFELVRRGISTCFQTWTLVDCTALMAHGPWQGLPTHPNPLGPEPFAGCGTAEGNCLLCMKLLVHSRAYCKQSGGRAPEHQDPDRCAPPIFAEGPVELGP